MMNVWKKYLTAFIVTLMILSSTLSVLAAVQGSQENPLVTLSYLKDVFNKTILQEADKTIAASATTFEKKLDDKVKAYTDEMKNLSGSGGGSSTGAEFTEVNLSSGQTLSPAVGCELLLRSGTAQCSSAENPGLIDSTSGGTLNNGKNMEKNHLYMATSEGRSVKAVGGAVKLMLRGSYTIQ